ncbi:MAG: hypothetical protein FJ295_17255 [Planctomycetes bacterium]|nr:hypothetical protein [Planctomycetota bacterium]
MRRRFWIRIGVLTVLCIPSAAHAGWPTLGEIWDRFTLDTVRNAAWPEPFRSQDREALRAPFAIMKDNGWRFETTVPDSLFHTETQDLNKAGEIKVRRILTYAPPHRRTLYVLRGSNDRITSLRVESVKQFVAQLNLRGANPEVLVTDIDPTNTSGEYFDQIDKKARGSITDPRLPSAAGAGGGGGTGGI